MNTSCKCAQRVLETMLKSIDLSWTCSFENSSPQHAIKANGVAIFRCQHHLTFRTTEVLRNLVFTEITASDWNCVEGRTLRNGHIRIWHLTGTLKIRNELTLSDKILRLSIKALEENNRENRRETLFHNSEHSVSSMVSNPRARTPRDWLTMTLIQRPPWRPPKQTPWKNATCLEEMPQMLDFRV